MVELKGSEKQIAWAEQNRSAMVNTVKKEIERNENMLSRAKVERPDKVKFFEKAVKYLSNLLNEIENIEDAKFFIEKKGYANARISEMRDIISAEPNETVETTTEEAEEAEEVTADQIIEAVRKTSSRITLSKEAIQSILDAGYDKIKVGSILEEKSPHKIVKTSDREVTIYKDGKVKEIYEPSVADKRYLLVTYAILRAING